jgi:DegV family protein with EDD domain
VTKIGFVTDSTAYLPPEIIKRYDIKVGPQVLIWGQEELADGVDIAPDEFYARLKSSTVNPTTSQVTIATFQKIFEPLVAEGTPILAVLISTKLSGTVQSAIQAKELFPGATIEIVDSEATAMALGFQLLEAARAAEEGRPFAEVVEIARKAKNHTGVLFVVDTLEFLHRGGRIGGAKKLFGTALKVKPLLELQNGRIEPLVNVRTKAKATARLLDELEQRLGGRKPIRIAALHAAAPDEAKRLKEEAEKRFQPVESMLAEVSPVVGTHAGPGTIGICYSYGV